MVSAYDGPLRARELVRACAVWATGFCDLRAACEALWELGPDVDLVFGGVFPGWKEAVLPAISETRFGTGLGVL